MVGSSPEVLVRLRDGVVTIRPLAGTRRRGMTYEEDQALEAELLADPKERAEHLMLLDLGRNDVGRVAALGSVKVTESFVIERFSHVMHISSNVEGRLAEGLDALDALVGGFPAGTLSGAPKVRAMEIIEELEPTRRNIYAGCIGYFAANGTMDTCIGLRTALVKDGVMYVQAGAGIVADLVPEAEYQECHQKARALVRAGGGGGALRCRQGRRQQRGVGRNAGRWPLYGDSELPIGTMRQAGRGALLPRRGGRSSNSRVCMPAEKSSGPVRTLTVPAHHHHAGRVCDSGGAHGAGRHEAGPPPFPSGSDQAPPWKLGKS